MTIGPLYPVGLAVAGRPVLVVGGGRIATRKVRSLLDCGAEVTIVAPVVDEAMPLDALQWLRRTFEPSDVNGARLVITATGDPDIDGAVFAAAENAGVWVNSADDPANCSFVLPAVVRRGRVSVAVSTEGASPAMASWLRDQIAARWGEELATLAELLAERRAQLRRNGVSTEDIDWQSVLEAGMLDDVRAGRIDDVRRRLEQLGPEIRPGETA